MAPSTFTSAPAQVVPSKIADSIAAKSAALTMPSQFASPGRPGAGVAVSVGVLVLWGVSVTVSVGVTVLVDVIVWVGVAVLVKVALLVDVAVRVGVPVCVGVPVMVGVPVCVGVFVLVGVIVLVDVAVLVGVIVFVGSTHGGVTGTAKHPSRGSHISTVQKRPSLQTWVRQLSEQPPQLTGG